MTNETTTRVNSSTVEGWFVVWTESRAEKRVESRIAAQGLEPWLPTLTERRRWSDRWKEVVSPLFPGYLFARGALAQLPSILRTAGVVSVVKNGRRPALLSDEFIRSLQRALETASLGASTITPTTEYEVGDEVLVREGPLAGLRGVVGQVRSARHLVVWIHAIGRGVAFTLGSALVSPVAATRAG